MTTMADIRVGSRWRNRKNRRVAEVTGTTPGWIEYRYVEPVAPTARHPHTQTARLRGFLLDFTAEPS